MGYYDSEIREELGVERLPQGSFVLPVINGENAGLWFMRVDFGGGHRSGYVKTEQDGFDQIEDQRVRTAASWTEKIGWMNNGDRAPSVDLTGAQMAVVMSGLPARKPEPASTGPRNILRVDGKHYTVRTFGIQKNRSFLGFGGLTWRWRWLDDPTGVVHESNDLFTQGEIPADFRDDLPDNGVWIPQEPKDSLVKGNFP